jgi:hypothetical protein
MSLYIRGFRDYSIEILITNGKFKKNRTHLLINPNNEIHLDIDNNESKQGLINPEGISHFVLLSSSIIVPESFDKTLKLAELLNKPIITLEKFVSSLKQNAISIKQLRIIESDTEVIPHTIIRPIYFNNKDYNPEDEYVATDEKSVSLEKLIAGPKKVANRTYKTINRYYKFPIYNKLIKPIIKKNNHVKEIRDLSNPIGVCIKFHKVKILLPLDRHGSNYLGKMVEIHQPEIVIMPNSSLSMLQSLSKSVKSVVLFDPNHKYDNQMIIPKVYNEHLGYDTYLATYEEWIDIEV